MEAVPHSVLLVLRDGYAKCVVVSPRIGGGKTRKVACHVPAK